MNDRALLGVSLEDISSGRSLYDTTTQANDVLIPLVFEEPFQDLGLRLAEGRPPHPPVLWIAAIIASVSFGTEILHSFSSVFMYFVVAYYSDKR